MSQDISIQKLPVTWVVVADGKQAQVYQLGTKTRRIPLFGNKRLYNVQTTAANLVPVAGTNWKAASPHIYEFKKRTMGSMFKGSGPAHQMYSPNMDIHDEVKQHFMKKIALDLELASTKKAFDRLVLVAPPKMLGLLKEALRGDVAHKVVGVLSKDLTHYKGGNLLKHLEGVLPHVA